MQEKGMFFYDFFTPQKNYCPSFLPPPAETNITKNEPSADFFLTKVRTFEISGGHTLIFTNHMSCKRM